MQAGAAICLSATDACKHSLSRMLQISEIFMVNKTSDQRAQELNDLKLELASFAVRLDAFEAYTKRRLIVAIPESSERKDRGKQAG